MGDRFHSACAYVKSKPDIYYPMKRMRPGFVEWNIVEIAPLAWGSM